MMDVYNKQVWRHICSRNMVVLTVMWVLLVAGGAAQTEFAEAADLKTYRERASSDDAQTIREAFFHAEARALVIRHLEPNKLRVGGGKFRVKRNPKGEGCFVYDPRTRFSGVERYLVWWIPEEEKAYPLNGPSKMITPGLKWAREAGTKSPSTSEVIGYVFKGKAMSRPSVRSSTQQTRTFSVKEYRIYHAILNAPMSISDTQSLKNAGKRYGVTEEEAQSAAEKVQSILFLNKWYGTPKSEIRHASDWEGEKP